MGFLTNNSVWESVKKIIAGDIAGPASVGGVTNEPHQHLSNRSTHIKTTSDDHIGLATAHGATNSATANTIAVRDAGGRLKAAAPVSDEDVVRKIDISGLTGATELAIAASLQNASTSIYWDSEIGIDIYGRVVIETAYDQPTLYPVVGEKYYASSTYFDPTGGSPHPAYNLVIEVMEIFGEADRAGGYVDLSVRVRKVSGAGNPDFPYSSKIVKLENSPFTYSQTGTVATVTQVAHGHVAGHTVFLVVQGGTLATGWYDVVSVDTDTFTVTAATATTSGTGFAQKAKLNVINHNIHSFYIGTDNGAAPMNCANFNNLLYADIVYKASTKFYTLTTQPTISVYSSKSTGPQIDQTIFPVCAV